MSGRQQLWLVGLAALVFVTIQGFSFAQDAQLPEGKVVWNLQKAPRATTPTHQRVSMKGLWRWQPAKDVAGNVPPTDGWGYLQVPSAWPRGGRRGSAPSFYPNPNWEAGQLRDVTAAWYQIDINVPGEWTGRRIALSAEFLHSFATVYVDGKKAGEMRFPAGEVDLTSMCRPGQKHTVSMLVIAMPLKAVVLSFRDSAEAKKIRGSVSRRGLCGDVYLVGTPRGARISKVRVETSVRKWQITLNAAVDGAEPQASYALHAKIKDGEQTVKEFTSKPFKGADVRDGRISVTEAWHPRKLWDIHTPQNQYDIDISLLDADGKLLDQMLPERFGFREFWIDGRDFYLNGTRVFLSFTRSGPGRTYERARATLESRKSVGINFVAVGGFGCPPGAHVSFEGTLRAADDVGTLIALTQPHFNQYEWRAPDADQKNGYAEHAEFYTRVAGNHPSVVFYATSHNAPGYANDMNPDLIDGLVDRSAWTRTYAERALRAGAIVKRFDDTRVLYHHAAGNLGSMHTSNFYANWTPIQEMSDWFEHWGTVGVKPVHPNEYAVPFPWDWSMYRGWYKGRRNFGAAVVPWEFCMAEWNAQFYGSQSYKIGKREATNLRWEAKKFREGARWQRWDYPHRFRQDQHPQWQRILAMYVTDNWRAFRTWGVSSNTPDMFKGPLATKALRRNNMGLLAYIGGKPGAFTSKDHNFLPGETVAKQLIVINNSRETVMGDCEWWFGLPDAANRTNTVVGAGTKKISLPTGEQTRIPLTFALPADLAAVRVARFERTGL